MIYFSYLCNVIIKQEQLILKTGGNSTIQQKIMKTTELTYDIHFNDDYDSNNKGFSSSLEYC